jgi:hypothetical protein
MWTRLNPNHDYMLKEMGLLELKKKTGFVF